jgi:ComF family protein
MIARPLLRSLQGLRQWGGDVLQLCYPAACIACEKPLSTPTSPGRRSFCVICEHTISNLEAAGACERCAMPLSSDGQPCPWCEGEGLKPYDRVVRLGTMSEPLNHLIHRIKYHGRWTIAEQLTDRLIARPRVRKVLDETDVLLPVPLHTFRHIKRGFNQADVIAVRLSRSNGRRIKISHAVVRLRSTKTQANVHGRENRSKNVKDAFGLVRARDLAGKRVTVVDDVLTTGATLQAVARCIKEAKPACINAIALAIADPEGRNFEVL